MKNKCKCGNNEFEIDQLGICFVEVILKCKLCSKCYALDLDNTTIVFNSNSALIDLNGRCIEEDE